MLNEVLGGNNGTVIAIGGAQPTAVSPVMSACSSCIAAKEIHWLKYLEKKCSGTAACESQGQGGERQRSRTRKVVPTCISTTPLLASLRVTTGGASTLGSQPQCFSGEGHGGSEGRESPDVPQPFDLDWP